MRFIEVRAQNFRNFPLLGASFPGSANFICGANGQGKTNLLEALGLVTSLRSFRATDLQALVRDAAGCQEAVLVFEIDHEDLGQTTLEIHLRSGSKQVLLDGNPIRKLVEIIGRFPTITFSSHDIQILRGTPANRRRVMDLMFVVMDPEYYDILQRYHKSLKARNSLLKQMASASQLGPFEEILIREGWALTDRRRQLLDAFAPHFLAAYSGISRVDEQPELLYLSPSKSADKAEYTTAFKARARRDLDYRSTTFGPHRDDLGIQLQGRVAREFASEGQQRGLVLALRMGLVEWYRQRGGTTPVILADDIVGELDGNRRRGFWEMLGDRYQIFATGTHLPREDSYHDWTTYTMFAGDLTPGVEEVPS